MACKSKCIFCQRRTQCRSIFWLLFLILSLSHVRFMAEDRAMPKLVKASHKRNYDEKVMMVRSLIGSSPPRCERRCGSSCNHCKAIQVPIAPSIKHQQESTTHQFYATPTIAYSRGDDISNYKPMRWKCKCGNFIFNP